MSAAVRPAGEGDLDYIAALEKITFSDGAAPDTLRAMFADGRHVFLIAPGGYAWYEFVLDEGYVGNVAVEERCRRQGLGKALVKAMEEDARARALSFLTLEVRESNAPARALYAACGYQTVAVRKNYYERPREDAILMTLDLCDSNRSPSR